MRIGLVWSMAGALALGGCAMRDSGGSGDGGTGGATSGSDPDGVAPPGCEDLFDDGSFDCNDSLQEDCDYLAEHPDLAVEWGVVFELDVGDGGLPPEEAISDFERKAQCITEYLDGLGVEHGSIDGDFFGVVATYAQIEPLCSATMIDVCEPWPREETCADLDEAACEENPLCSSYRGSRIEAGADCVKHDLFAACNTGACGDMLVVLVDPNGACWYFYEDCDHHEGWTESLGDCPDWDALDTLPECEG
jgi:hypothetical protein